MRFIFMSSLLCAVLVVPSAMAQEAAAASEVQSDPAAEAPADAPVTGTSTSATAAEAAPATQADAADAEEADPGDGAGIAAPPEGKGQIVFFRDKKFTGAALSYIVRENGEELGKLSNGSYFVHVAEPGTHAYVVHSEAKDMLNLEVEPGETYYVVGSISMGVLAGRPNLSPSDQGTFDSLAGKLKPAKPVKKKD